MANNNRQLLENRARSNAISRAVPFNIHSTLLKSPRDNVAPGGRPAWHDVLIPRQPPFVNPSLQTAPS